MATPKFRAKVEKGKVVWCLETKQRFDEHLWSLNDKEVGVVVKQWQDQTARSRQQNNYYWGVVIALLSEHLGYTTEEMHEVCKQKFLASELTIGDETYRVLPKSTRALNTKQMEEYLENIRMFAAQDGCDIPLPNEIDYESK